MQARFHALGQRPRGAPRLVGKRRAPPSHASVYNSADGALIAPAARAPAAHARAAIAVLAAEGAVIGQVFSGLRFDTGDVLGLLRASLHFTRKRPEMREGVDAILAELQAGTIGR